MSKVDWLMLILSGMVATVVVLAIFAGVALFRCWFAADRREASMRGRTT